MVLSGRMDDGVTLISDSRPIDKKEVFGWAMFDFANSSFTTLIVTVAFPIYFTSVVAPGGKGDALWALSANIALAVVILTSPLLGALADFSASKKRFLFVTYLGCVVCTAALYLVGPGDVYLGMAIFVLAKIFFSAGENFTSAFLPDIAPPSKMGKVSGFAWALGFLGGIACLKLCEPFMGHMEDASHAGETRMIVVITAAFFLLAGIPTFLFLRERGSQNVLPKGESYLSIGMGRLRETMGHVFKLVELVKFLLVFTIFNCGLSVVVYFTSIYAINEIHFTPSEFMHFFVMMNVLAAAGAFVFGILQDRIGAKLAINLTLVLWMCSTMTAYLSRDAKTFWIAGIFAGSALGATQAGSRALVGEFSPPSRSAEFFGFWGIFWKLSEGIGPMIFGLISAAGATVSEGRRMGILVTTLFFVVGFIGMFFIDHEKGILEAKTYEEETRRHEQEMREATALG